MRCCDNKFRFLREVKIPGVSIERRRLGIADLIEIALALLGAAVWYIDARRPS